MAEYRKPPSEAWKHFTDILRLTVTCYSIEEVKQFAKLNLTRNGLRMQVLRFKPRFTGPLKDMIINFNWRDKVLCELQIKLGNLPPGYHEQHFIYECRRTAKAEDYGMMVDAVTKKINTLRERKRLVGEKVDIGRGMTMVDRRLQRNRKFEYDTKEKEM